MKSTLILTSSFALLFFGAYSFAADKPDSQKKPADTAAKITQLFNELDKDGPICDKNYQQFQCPTMKGKFPGKGIKQTGIDPLREKFARARDKINAIDLSPATSAAKQSTLAGVDAGKGQEQAKLADIAPRLKALQDALPIVNSIDSELKARRQEMFKNDPNLKNSARSCAVEIVGNSWLVPESKLPNHEHDGLRYVFTNEHNSCPTNDRAKIDSILDEHWPKLEKELAEFKTYLSTNIANLEKEKSAAEARLAKLDEAKQPETQAAKPAAKESKVSGDTKPATVASAKGDKGATVSEQKVKAAETPAVAQAAKPEAKADGVTPPKGENTSADTTQNFLADTAPKSEGAAKEDATAQNKDLTVQSTSAQNGVPTPDTTQLKPITADDLDAKNTYQSKSDVELKPTQDAPAAQALDDAPQRGTVSGDRTVAQAKNDYQNDPIFKARDLDFNSTKDTRYIQNALNQVRKDQGLPPLSTDGVMGSRTTLALDQVMQNPDQKAAFIKALRVQMAKR